MDKRDAPGNGYNVNQAQYAAAAAAQQAKNTYAAQTAQAAHQVCFHFPRFSTSVRIYNVF